jgi:hypothetical protein
MALVPGELPGYTGWARPETTLAGYFTTTSLSNLQPRTGQEFSITVQCRGHEDCSNGASLFFLRAYGPSVISGYVVNEGQGVYKMEFLPLDPGAYTVEVVLTFSNPPSLDSFPLPSDQPEPPYEGFLLPGFPLQIYVQESVDDKENSRGHDGDMCSFDHLIESSPTSALAKARWKVKSKSNGPNYISGTQNKKISEAGYIEGINSLGIQMAYDYVSNCTLLAPAAFAKTQGNNHPFVRCRKNLQIIFIGDSVMRVQKAMFDGMVSHLPHITTSYVNLYGGYRRCEKLGRPDIKIHLDDVQRRAPNDAKAILFNTGLHDIHRLCGQEWTDDRYEYLDKDKLDSGQFGCANEYRSLLKDFAELIKAFPADLKIFQSSTGAWPKYGNFGLNWAYGAQALPVAPEAVSFFNDIAFQVLEEYHESIQIMDGYWITYSRPDNREIGDTGQKLSHPGLEVQSAMSRIWSILILERLCEMT